MLYCPRDGCTSVSDQGLCDNGRSQWRKWPGHKGIAFETRSWDQPVLVSGSLRSAEAAVCQEGGNELPGSSGPVSLQGHKSAFYQHKIRSVKKFTVPLRCKQTDWLGRRRSALAKPGKHFSHTSLYGMKNISAASIQEDGLRGKLFQNDRWNQNKYNLVKKIL